MSILKHPWSPQGWEWLWWGEEFPCPQDKGIAWAHTECLCSVFQTKTLRPLCSDTLDTLVIPAPQSLLRLKFCWPWGQICRTRVCREVTSTPIRAAKLTEYLLHIPLNYSKAWKKKSLISLTHTASVAGTTRCFSLRLSEILLILAGWLKWATVCFLSSLIDNGRQLWTMSNLLWNHRVLTGNVK